MAGAAPIGGMLGITVTVAGVPQMARVMGVMASRVIHLLPVWDDVAEDFKKREKYLFSRQGAVPGWSKWQALSPNYLEWKKRHGYSSRIMVMKDPLRESLKGGSGYIFRPRAMSMEIGTTIPYAIYHQKGARGRRRGLRKLFTRSGGLPRREPIRISDPQKKLIVKLIQKFLLASDQFDRANLSPTGKIRTLARRG